MVAHPRILVVEDETIVAMDLQESLTALGYHVVGVADTGRRALRLAEETCPDLAVMDIQIRGEMNGIDAASEIRRRFQIPVIFLTAFTDESTVQWAKQAGPLAYLSKPFRIEELNATIVIALQQDRLIRDLFAERTWLTTLLEGISEGVIATDALGTVRFLNPQAQELTGWTPSEAMDRVIEDVGALVVMGGLECPLRQSMRTAVAMNKQRCILRSRAGREIPVDASATPIVTGGQVVGAVTVFRDISRELSSDAAPAENGGMEHKAQRAPELLGHAREESRSIAQRLLAMQEDERRRIARELHDDLSQRLATVGMETSILLRHIADPPDLLSDRIRDLASRIGELAEELHGLSRQIHPAILNDLGLATAMEEECRSLSRRTAIPVDFGAENVPRSLPEDVALCMFRVAQEALRNVGKHANASHVRVRLARLQHSLDLSIEDAGGGFDFNDNSHRGGLGLISMRERVQLLDGDFAINSQPGQGTRVEISVPLREDVG